MIPKTNKRIIFDDALRGLDKIPDESVDTIITSPPYFRLRDYGVDRQIGLEKTPEEYIRRLVEVFHEAWRVLKEDGTLWIVIGDCYAQTAYEDSDYGIIRSRNLTGIPWMLAFALRADGWYLRQDIIWHKPNVMPESVRSRCTRCHEYVFMFSKSKKYYYNYKAIREPAQYDGRQDILNKGALKYSDPEIRVGKPHSLALAGKPHQRWIFDENGQPVKNKRDVWKIATRPFKGAHFATFPEELVKPCILAGSRPGGIVLDPFCGSGTTVKVAADLGRVGIGIELNRDYAEVIHERIGEYDEI